MTLFDDSAPVSPGPRRPSRAVVAGIWTLSAALVVLLILTFLPTGYVIQRPGPVYNTLGSAPGPDGEEVPLITVQGAETYPTEGALDLLTVQVVGSRERTPSWFELATAWFDRTRAVLPIEAVFPTDQTVEQRQSENAALMVDSQQEATAAALSELGYDVSPQLRVYSVAEDSAADGVLREDDVILAADGEQVTDVAALRGIVDASEGAPVDLTILRDGGTRSLALVPQQEGEDPDAPWLIGVTLMSDYDFPVDVEIQLDNVGGPSAGMMFALGIIDVLTPGELNGGERVAGSGTITAQGIVGPIGGVRQKLWGAVGDGASYFLAAEANCPEIVGHVPDGLHVFAVEDLDDAMRALDAVATGGDLDALPTCDT
ncbi:YlbL family protein [Microbacterium aurantiacum]|uniref:PDZ domain-containing protein n=1 Tax=Microbacterium aurantiacum TaxID=162393 RepID=A0ABT8FRY1_9MICO|nr:PDZ domain-containing protein [Microbacterium aurantiacum]MDN4463965.1 PDZ domain-containing protein [Microbacterium aurantiacum]